MQEIRIYFAVSKNPLKHNARMREVFFKFLDDNLKYTLEDLPIPNGQLFCVYLSLKCSLGYARDALQCAVNKAGSISKSEPFEVTLMEFTPFVASKH